MSVIQTYSGAQFDVLRPKASSINLNDIAHALSNLCRFTGHVRRFYSVAEHCVWVSRIVRPKNALAGLLHDATEAYVSDIAAPVKNTAELASYRSIERRLWLAIATRFEVDPLLPNDVHEADSRMAATEARCLMEPIPAWVWARRPYMFDVDAWEPARAEEEYVTRFLELDLQRKHGLEVSA